MKNTFKKITAIAAVSLLAVSQVPAANILAKDGVATMSFHDWVKAHCIV